jgi:hypothetical protein
MINLHIKTRLILAPRWTIRVICILGKEGGFTPQELANATPIITQHLMESNSNLSDSAMREIIASIRASLV